MASVLVLSAVLLVLFIYFNSAPDTAPAVSSDDTSLKLENADTVYFEVRSGETALSVGRRLENANIIRSQYLWYVISRLDNEYIKTGTYRIDLPSTVLRIHSLLVSGDQLLFRVTIPEGVTLKKTANILEENGICTADDFLKAASSPELRDYYHIPGPTMEGYLFPDTYLFPLRFPADKVIHIMADNFYSKLAAMIPESNSLDSSALNDKVILASIIEREYRVDEEAPVMASVFYNRLRIGMALQSCATVEYVITEVLGKPHPDVLYNKDLEIQDPYNTYMHSGLPPGPISAPGQVALNAVFHPATSDYLYFRLIDQDSGRHYFSRTLDDHIRAGALYLKGN